MGRVDLDGISDDRKFQDVALLIDRTDFQEELKLLKKDLDNLSGSNTTLDTFLIPAFRLRLAIQLVAKYHYPPGFGQAILAVIDKGKVTDRDVNNLYTKTHLHSFIQEEKYPYYSDKNEVLISVYPYTLKDRKQKITEEIAKILRGIETMSQPLPLNHPLNQSSIDTIRTQRELYWFRKCLKKGYKKLAKELNLKGHEGHETIRSQICAYESLLKLGVLT